MCNSNNAEKGTRMELYGEYCFHILLDWGWHECEVDSDAMMYSVSPRAITKQITKN